MANHTYNSKNRLIGVIWILALMATVWAVIKCLPRTIEPVQVQSVWRSPEIEALLADK